MHVSTKYNKVQAGYTARCDVEREDFLMMDNDEYRCLLQNSATASSFSGLITYLSLFARYERTNCGHFDETNPEYFLSISTEKNMWLVNILRYEGV